MKILKLLNRGYLSIIFIFSLIGSQINADEKPVDIWNIDKEKIKNENLSDVQGEDNKFLDQSIYDLQSNKVIQGVEVETNLNSKKLKVVGLYDPQDHDLKIDMWLKSDGDQLKYLFSNINKFKLSDDASYLMNILLLTNAYYPNINIKENEFLKIKSDWLIKNENKDLIEEYLLNNQIINLHPKLSRFLVDEYLSESNIKKACELFSKNEKIIIDEYLSKFNLYCLIYDEKFEEAQLIYDLKKESGFIDEYYENKLNFLFGYLEKPDLSISEKSILDFHLAHKTNPNFIFEPKKNTDKIIWKYLASSNLLVNVNDIQIEDLDKISLIEKATHDKNYSETNLFEIYKRFQFSLDQLLNASEAYKSLSNVEAKALLYQKILLESDVKIKLDYIRTLKELFIKDNHKNAFEGELVRLLENIDSKEVPSNFTTFYFSYLKKEEKQKNIKFNRDILHQSKLVNYFNGDYAKSKIEKDLENFLKKIKKNNKYVISKKDIMIIESMRSDGIEISKKFDNLYELEYSEMPTDIQVMINNKEVASTLLRIIEVIGQDQLENLDEDTLYFIIDALNQLDIDQIRNEILLKVLPLKV
tara:strand:+ start:3166 stop:4923 length:1758 start_codon:yes stop_codon:yes gene_type:complete